MLNLVEQSRKFVPRQPWCHEVKVIMEGEEMGRIPDGGGGHVVSGDRKNIVSVYEHVRGNQGSVRCAVWRGSDPPRYFFMVGSHNTVRINGLKITHRGWQPWERRGTAFEVSDPYEVPSNLSNL